MKKEIIPFTHLHTHTPEGSLLDGFMRIEKAVAQAKEWGMDALGVSDHGTMAAHQKFYTHCKSEGIHPVLGMEAYITYDKTFKKEDFEAIEFTLDDDNDKIFGLIEKEKIDEGWFPIDNFSRKASRTSLEREAFETYGVELYNKTKMEGEGELKPTVLKKRVKALMKSHTDNGLVLCVKADTKRKDFFEWFPRMGHLLLIAKNNEGYQNLLQLNAIGQLDGFYGKPRIDYEDIKKYGSGIVATTACLGSVVSQLILKGKLEEAKKEIARLVDAFDEVFLEVQPSRQPEQWVVNNQLFVWSKELNLPLIATTDAHMVSSDELELHKTLTNIGSGASSFSEDSSDISVYESAYLMHPQEILNRGIPPEALQNAYDLSHRCQVDFLELNDTKFPEYKVPTGKTFDSYLEELATQGLFDLFLRKDYIQDYELYQERLFYELGIIKQKGLSAYFIIVWDYIAWAREQGIYVGPGRGSAAGSLVAYALTITNIDPIKYDLLFERGLHALVKFR